MARYEDGWMRADDGSRGKESERNKCIKSRKYTSNSPPSNPSKREGYTPRAD
jgi:hypothetical protein